MCVWVGISIALCHLSGVEQLFINKVQRAAKKCLPTFTVKMQNGTISVKQLVALTSLGLCFVLSVYFEN